MEQGHYRYITSVIIGVFLGLFGVFLYSNFQYRGIQLQDDVLSLISNSNTRSAGLYQLFGAGFQANIFSTDADFFGNTVWPAFIAWIVVGGVTGGIAKGLKRGTIATIGVFAIILLFWLLIGILAGENMTEIYKNGTGERIGQIFTTLIFTLPAGALSGLICGPHNS